MNAVPAAAHRLAVRVYYEDTDLAGIVYHANYLRFMERGRTEALRAAGVSQGALKGETGVVLVVRRMEIDFRRPALFDDLIEVATWAKVRRGASVDMGQAVMRGAEVLCHADVIVAATDRAGKPVRLPEAVRAALDRIAPTL